MESSDRLPRHLVTAFILAVIIYASFFACDQSIRKRKGGWVVGFHTNSIGQPAISINQPALGVSNVFITFLDEVATNSGRIVFDRPKQPIPFGKVKFEDLTYLPGSVAFDFFGHEVELLPRTLYLNKKEHSWAPNSGFELAADQKLPPGASYDPRARKRRLFSPKPASTNQ